jgi:hypothetical protein
MPQVDAPRIIHIIFKTHLDVGFTDYAGSVVRNYFEHFIPAALDLADEMRHRGGPARFVWTTGSWLIYEYLEQASAPQRERMEAAIRRGDIVWHGLPFTTHSELNDADLFRSGLSLAAELDQRFNRKTIAAKMTDVPGHTRSIVPLLAEAGMTFLHIGVNEASTPPDVPAVFRWRDPAGAEVMVMYHKGYGALMLVPGLDEGIYFAHTNDNHGPQSPEGVEATFAELQARFPGAELRASTMDAFAVALERVRETLPVVTGEIGDSWIHGGATDPLKLARLRELLRLRKNWLAAGQVQRSDPAYRAFCRNLQLVTEHTWGMDEKTHLRDYENYAAEAFQAALHQPNFQKFAASWQEQRAYIDQAVAALEGTPLHGEAVSALAAVRPSLPDPETWTRVDPFQPFGAGRFLFGFNDQGGMALLRDQHARHTYADPDHTLGSFIYQTFSDDDYQRFYRQYVVNKRQTAAWSVDDFTKPGMAAAGAIGREWLPKLERLYLRSSDTAEQFLLWLALPAEAALRYGGPQELFVTVTVPMETPQIDFELQWFDKAPCRLPEALWFSFNPRTASGGRWEMDKLGGWVSPLEVVRDGNRHLHAVGEGVRWTRGAERLQINSLDAALVAPGQRSLLNFTNRQPGLAGGMHFLLCDNLWGTNFPMWFGEDARFRFQVKLNG